MYMLLQNNRYPNTCTCTFFCRIIDTLIHVHVLFKLSEKNQLIFLFSLLTFIFKNVTFVPTCCPIGQMCPLGLKAGSSTLTSVLMAVLVQWDWVMCSGACSATFWMSASRPSTYLVTTITRPVRAYTQLACTDGLPRDTLLMRSSNLSRALNEKSVYHMCL